MTRREFIEKSLSTLVSVSFLEMLITRDLLAGSIKEKTDHWAIQLNDMCRDLKKQAIRPSVWQTRIEALLGTVEQADLVKFIDFDKLTRAFQYPDLGVNTKYVTFPKIAGLPDDVQFVKKIFGMKQDRAIIPHGHKNMVSAHYVLFGEFDLKHYDKLGEDDTHLIITPTVDTVVKPGSVSSISDEKNNVHWFKARSEIAFTFDMLIFNVDPSFGKSYDIDNIDPYEAEEIRPNVWRAPKLDVDTALKKYGKETHH